MKPHQHLSLNLGEDPFVVLELEPNAGPEQIRAAYIAKVKQYPPDRNPVEFERIRDAYEYLHNPKYRAYEMLRTANPYVSFVSLLDSVKKQRRFVGPEPWLAVLKETIS